MPHGRKDFKIAVIGGRCAERYGEVRRGAATRDTARRVPLRPKTPPTLVCCKMQLNNVPAAPAAVHHSVSWGQGVSKRGTTDWFSVFSRWMVSGRGAGWWTGEVGECGWGGGRVGGGRRRGCAMLSSKGDVREGN